MPNLLRRSAVTMLLAILLSTVFVAQTARTAEAISVNPRQVLGAMRTSAVPRLMTMFTPWGIAIGAGSLILEGTSDVWVPWLGGLLGIGGDSKSTTPPATCPNARSWGASSPAADTADAANTYHIVSTASCGTFYGSTDQFTAPIPYRLACKVVATGEISVSETTEQVAYIRYDQTGTANAYLRGCAIGSIPHEVRVSPHDPATQTSVRASSSAPGLSFIAQGAAFTQPQTKYQTDMTCKRPDGTTFVINMTGAPGENAGAPLPACEAAAIGARPVKADFRAGSGTTPGVPPIQQTAQWPATSTEYPNCVTGTVCTLLVKIDGQPCQVGGTACSNWLQTNAERPGAVTCHWGEYTMPLNDCAVLEGAYVSGGTQVTSPGTIDGQQGNNTASPAPSSPPQGDPTAPGVNPSNGDTCIETNFSWNPISWVYAPVYCVLKAAFVPSPETISGWKTRIESLKTRPPLSIAVAGANIFAAERDALSADACGSRTTITTLGGSSTEFDPICAIGAQVQGTTTGQTIYKIFRAGAYTALGYFIWVRVFRSVGTKEITGGPDDK